MADGTELDDRAERRARHACRCFGRLVAVRDPRRAGRPHRRGGPADPDPGPRSWSTTPAPATSAATSPPSTSSPPCTGRCSNVTPETVDDPERDRFILSKGHVAGALYTTLAAFGFLPVAELATFLKPLSRLNGHPNRNKVRGVEANTGPLGHGLPIAVGHALSAKLDVSRRRTYVLVGDGELQEGSNWEAMMAASQYELDRLTVIVDRNRLQQGATVRETNDLDPLDQKAAAFGFAVVEVNGHDHGELLDVLSAVPFRPGKPTFVIAHTHKGHPISFMSNNVAWHHKVPTAAELRAGARRAQRRPPQPRRTPHDRHDLTTAPARIADQPRFDCRNAYVETLADLAQEDHRIVGVVNDSVGSSKLDAFKKAFPDRLINVGIAEQDMVGVAAGSGQRRPDPVRLRRLLLPDRARAGADQGRRRLLQPQRQAVRHEPRHGVRRARPDPPLDRGHRLAAGDRQHDHRGAGRPDRDGRRDALGRRHRGSGRSSASAG